jgi:hypothetical protein
MIPKVMTLKTLADVRELMRHLPADRRDRATWRHVAAQLNEAAAGADPTDVVVALRMVFMLEGVGPFAVTKPAQRRNIHGHDRNRAQRSGRRK